MSTLQILTAEKVTELNAAFNFSPILALVTDNLSSYSVTANAGTDILTATGHNFVNGTPVTFSNVGGGLPGAIAVGTVYFVVNVATNTFKISETIGGATIDITSTGSGTHTVTEAAIADMANSYTDASVVWDVMVRHEVASYQGSARQTFTLSPAVFGDILGEAIIPTATASIIPITGNITAYYAVILRGANLTRGDGAGAVAGWDYVKGVIDSQGAIFSFSPTFPS